MKILKTMRAGRVTRQSLYSPRDPNPNQRRRAIGISKEDKQQANLKTNAFCDEVDVKDVYERMTAYRNRYGQPPAEQAPADASAESVAE